MYIGTLIYRGTHIHMYLLTKLSAVPSPFLWSLGGPLKGCTRGTGSMYTYIYVYAWNLWKFIVWIVLSTGQLGPLSNLQLIRPPSKGLGFIDFAYLIHPRLTCSILFVSIISFWRIRAFGPSTLNLAWNTMPCSGHTFKTLCCWSLRFWYLSFMISFIVRRRGR